MLVTKEVEVKVSSKNVKRYGALGYDIPKKANGKSDYNKTLKVKVEDLYPCSREIVEVECDYCGKHTNTAYADYRKHNHNGITYCRNCAPKVLLSGENNWNYNFDKTDEERELSRNYPEYVDFIKRVLARDKYTCQVCGKKSDGDMAVHHLDSYDWCKEKRTDDTNGITLCGEHHKAFHTLYGYGNNTKKQFEEWFGKAVELSKCNIEIQPRRQVYCVETDKVYNNSDIACKELNIKTLTQVHKVCNRDRSNKTANGYHLFWYDEYLKLSPEEIKANLKECDTNLNHKQVICLETLEVFETVLKARDKYGTSQYSNSQIIRACKNFGFTAYTLDDGTQLHWMYYDEYLNSSQEKIYKWKNTFLNSQRIICLNTKKIYQDGVKAGKEYNIHSNQIIDNCNGKYNSAGKFEDGTPICWMYYNDYIKLLEKGIEPKLHTNIVWKKVICITTGRIFNSTAKGKREYGSPNITDCCKGKQKTSGKLPDGTPLKWMYYEDFLKLPIEKQNEILNRNNESSTDGSFLLDKEAM